MRVVSALVLPVPAPASIRTGPSNRLDRGALGGVQVIQIGRGARGHGTLRKRHSWGVRRRLKGVIFIITVHAAKLARIAQGKGLFFYCSLFKVVTRGVLSRIAVGITGKMPRKGKDVIVGPIGKKPQGAGLFGGKKGIQQGLRIGPWQKQQQAETVNWTAARRSGPATEQDRPVDQSPRLARGR